MRVCALLAILGGTYQNCGRHAMVALVVMQSGWLAIFLSPFYCPPPPVLHMDPHAVPRMDPHPAHGWTAPKLQLQLHRPAPWYPYVHPWHHYCRCTRPAPPCTPSHMTRTMVPVRASMAVSRGGTSEPHESIMLHSIAQQRGRGGGGGAGSHESIMQHSTAQHRGQGGGVVGGGRLT